MFCEVIMTLTFDLHPHKYNLFICESKGTFLLKAEDVPSRCS